VRFLLLILLPAGVAGFVPISTFMGRWSERRRRAAIILIFSFLLFLSVITPCIAFLEGLPWLAHNRLTMRHLLLQPIVGDRGDNYRETDPIPGMLTSREVKELEGRDAQDAHAAEAYRQTVDEQYQLGRSFLRELSEISLWCAVLFLTSIVGLCACRKAEAGAAPPADPSGPKPAPK
jgi:hypothetical protein